MSLAVVSEWTRTPHDVTNPPWPETPSSPAASRIFAADDLAREITLRRHAPVGHSTSRTASAPGHTRSLAT